MLVFRTKLCAVQKSIFEILPMLEVNYIFRQACHLSKDLIKNPLIVPNKGLGVDRDEFWFNIAKPGESTGWHDHKKDPSCRVFII